MRPGDFVRFPRREPVVDGEGLLYRMDEWTQVGEVRGIRPDLRVDVIWDDPHWGAATGTFTPDELTLVGPEDPL